MYKNVLYKKGMVEIDALAPGRKYPRGKNDRRMVCDPRKQIASDAYSVEMQKPRSRHLSQLKSMRTSKMLHAARNASNSKKRKAKGSHSKELIEVVRDTNRGS